MITEKQAETRNTAAYGAMSDTSKILASVFRYPARPLVEQLTSLEFCNVILQLQIDMGIAPEERFDTLVLREKLYVNKPVDESLLSEVRCAYTALFSHPESPLMPPYESQYLYWRNHPDGTFDDAPRMFVCPAATDAERIYKKAGLYRSEEFNEPGDFISTELEFVSHLLARIEELSAQDSDAHAAAEELEWLSEVYAEFSYYHIQKWWRSFFSELATFQTYSFYGLMGSMGLHLLDALSKVSLIGEVN